jgi:hypothetical protein
MEKIGYFMGLGLQNRRHWRMYVVKLFKPVASGLNNLSVVT